MTGIQVSFDKNSEINFTNTEFKDIINLVNINQLYGSNVIIKDFNLLIEDKPNQNQFVVLLGKSGCGKSTILRYICGIQKPTSGEIVINEGHVNNNHTVSMVFQQYSNFPWKTVLENVMFPLEIEGKLSKKEMKEQAMHWIEKVELLGHENKFAQYPLLSGGQLQRVAIARSLVCNSEILLLDEPFGALDIQTRNNMQHLLAKLYVELPNITMILVTHDIREAVFLGDDIFIMSSNPGKIVDYINIDLPYDRRDELRNDPKFNEYVSIIETKMNSL